MTALDTLKQFLDHIFTGHLDAALAMVEPDAEFIAGPARGDARVPLYGRYVGPAGARELFTRFGATFEPGDFEVQGALTNEDMAVMHGRLEHRVRATDRPFASDWALVAHTRDGRLRRYQFHEDTAALVDAMA